MRLKHSSYFLRNTEIDRQQKHRLMTTLCGQLGNEKDQFYMI